MFSHAHTNNMKELSQIQSHLHRKIKTKTEASNHLQCCKNKQQEISERVNKLISFSNKDILNELLLLI